MICGIALNVSLLSYRSVNGFYVRFILKNVFVNTVILPNLYKDFSKIKLDLNYNNQETTRSTKAIILKSQP